MNTFKQELSAHPRGNIVSHKKKALIIGATGATGTQLLSLLLESDNWDKITTITRKPVLNGENHKKLNKIVIDSFDNLDQTAESWVGHDSFFNCIGTTRKIAGGAKQFVDIEFGLSLFPLYPMNCSLFLRKYFLDCENKTSLFSSIWNFETLFQLACANGICSSKKSLTKFITFLALS